MTKKAYTLASPDGSTSVELPVREGSVGPNGLDYDPGYMATGSCESDITFIDGQKGLLMYRGYPVEQLAANSNFIEVAYLLLYGELPTRTPWRCYPR